MQRIKDALRLTRTKALALALLGSAAFLSAPAQAFMTYNDETGAVAWDFSGIRDMIMGGFTPLMGIVALFLAIGVVVGLVIAYHKKSGRAAK